MNFDGAVYGCNAIRKAAAKFRGRLSVSIEQRGRFHEVRLIQNAYCDSYHSLVRDFCSEVLDQELRERVAREMTGIRNLLSAGTPTSLTKCA